MALMDEIGRRALTNAFINFTRNHNTSGVNPTAAYRDSLIYDDCRISTLDMEEEEDEEEEGKEEDEELERKRRKVKTSEMMTRSVLTTSFVFF